MNMTDIFVRRPVLSIVVSVLILLAGLQSIFDVTVRQYPKSDNAVIVIRTVYVGASAELVQGFVTSPIERAIASTAGVDYIDSQSTLGLSTINVFLKLNYDPVRAMAQINAKINQVRSDLPPEAEIPALEITAPDEFVAAAYLGFTSDVLSQSQITDYLTRAVQPRLSSLPGVQRADIFGARTFAMRIWLKPNNMAAFNISPADVRRALSANNVQSTLGKTKGSLIQINLSANTDLSSVNDFEQLILRSNEQGTIRMRDIADIELGAENYDNVMNLSGKTSAVIGIWVLPTANALDVIQSAINELEDIKSSLPTGLNARVSYDSTKYIAESIDEVMFTLSETLIIISIVIFLFLGFSRSVLIPLLAIPLSLIGSVFIIQLFGFSANLITLLAIVLCVGLVVDDAIIMVENIERHIEQGASPFNAALAAARELFGPIVSMTVTIVSVYIPIAFQGGLTGTLFKEFAVTLAGAIVISAIVALTLSPMLGAKLLKPNVHMSGPLEPWFKWFKHKYAAFLNISLNNRSAVYLFWVVISLLVIPMYIMSPKELAPPNDRGVIYGFLEGTADATIDQTYFYAKQANDVFMSIPETDFSFQVTLPNSGFSGIVLDAWSDRKRSVFDILPELQTGLDSIAGIRVLPVIPPALPGGSSFPMEFVILSTASSEEIYTFAQQLQNAAMQSGLFAFPPQIDLKIDQPDAQLVVDRDKVADYGLTLREINSDLSTLLGGNFVNRFNMSGFSYKVIPQVQRTSRLTPEDLNNLYISGPNGSLIRLAEVASIEESTVPRSLNRFQQLNAVKISGVPIVPLDQALRFMEDKAAEVLPKTYSVNYSGESRQLRKEGNKFLPAISMAVVIIFLVLAAQFNSFRDPLIVLLGSVPLAMFGALIFTFLKSPMNFWTDSWTTTLNIYSQVGLVTLIGLIVRNGILVVEFANTLQAQGIAKLDAVKEAALVRLRPVLMTSIATVAGHMPLIFAAGAGAEARNAIGLILVLGMLIGTIFTLIVLPAVYVLFAKDYQKTSDKEELTHTPVAE